MSTKLTQLAKNLCKDDEEIGSLPWEDCTPQQRQRYNRKAIEILQFVLRDPGRPALKTVADRHRIPVTFLAQVWREVIDLISE